MINIKTDNNYYIYDKVNKEIYSSNNIIYFTLKYIEDNLLLLDELSEADIDKIATTNNFNTQDVNKSLLRVKYIYSILKNKKLSGVNSYKSINEKNIVESLANVKQIIIEITERCNMSCYYCCYGDIYKSCDSRKDDININRCLNALGQILTLLNSNYNVSTHNGIIISFYGGEPLLNFEGIREIVNYVKGLNLDFIKVQYAMTTNGVLLDKYIKFLFENEFNLMISLDGDLEQNSYRRLKNGHNSHGIVLNNIMCIIKEYPQYFDNKVNFISVLHNKNSLISLYKYFRKFNKKPYITTLSVEDVNENKNEEFNRMYNSGGISTSMLEDIKKMDFELYNDLLLNSDTGISSKFNELHSMIDIFDENLPHQDNNATCYLFQTKVFLAVSGEIYPCEKVHRKFTFGNYKDNKLEFYVDKIKCYYEIIKRHSNECCRDCFVKDQCKHCFFSEPEMYEKCNICKIDENIYTSNLIKAIQFEEKPLNILPYEQ